LPGYLISRVPIHDCGTEVRDQRPEIAAAKRRTLNIELQTSRVTRSVLRGPFDPLPIIRGQLKFRGSHILLEMLKR